LLRHGVESAGDVLAAGINPGEAFVHLVKRRDRCPLSRLCFRLLSQQPL
jgi:hypothetical protein